ncbi:hypothetical protein [Streptomyces sp. NBC_00878]|uniref:hypothetical protein n=1 Tax=Streptomyces sp. NBC_00878 TaxID=2975854 RepID=UPI002257EADF|nr:hypothetical protein [Streptomyces sp. NBC_00878]MCX4910504.1 hypothetical protein [Streptomyces sp. NBC_00878]
MADYTQPDVVPKRVRFFDGQFLKEQDFIDEQRFHLDRERRQSRLLRLTGISVGLTVTSDAERQITVTAGMAVDALGRHLVLAADTAVQLDEDFADQQGIEVHLAYRESASDMTPEGAPGGAGARRWDESPRIVVVAPDGTTMVAPDDASPDLDGQSVLLARLAVANGQVVVDLIAAQRSTLSVAGALGIGTTAPGSDLEIGDYGPQDRHLTFKVAGGDGHRSGLRLRAGSENDNEGYSLEYDRRPVAGQGLHVRTHGPDDPEGGTTRLFVDPGGDVGIGTTTPDNQGEWDRVLDLAGAARSKLSVRTATVAGHVAAHDTGVYGASPGMVVGTASVSPLTLVTGRAARLSVTATGHVGIGTTAPQVTGGWGRVVDVVGAGRTKLSVRTASVDGRVSVNDLGASGVASMVVGTETATPLSFVTTGSSRFTIGADGNISMGSDPFTARWTTKHVDTHEPAEPHLRLHRDDTTSGGNRLFLELFQGHGNPLQTDVYPSIRFHHSTRYWHRIEGRRDGLHIKTGSMASDAHTDLWAWGVHAESLTIGAVTIGAAELAVLKKLAAGQLSVTLFNVPKATYAFVSSDPISGTTHEVWANPGGSHPWVLKPLV